MKSNPVSERQLHIQVASYFKRVGLGGLAVAIHIHNESSKAFDRINSTKMGILRGCPDFLIIDSGRAGWIELKRPGWKASKARGNKLTAHERRQAETHDRLARAGAWVEICETLDEVLAALTLHGVPLRSSDLVTEALRNHLQLAMDAEEIER